MPASTTNMENVGDDIDAIRNALQTLTNGMNAVQGQLTPIAENLITGAEDTKKARQNMIDSGTAMVEARNLLGAS